VAARMAPRRTDSRRCCQAKGPLCLRAHFRRVQSASAFAGFGANRKSANRPAGQAFLRKGANSVFSPGIAASPLDTKERHRMRRLHDLLLEGETPRCIYGSASRHQVRGEAELLNLVSPSRWSCTAAARPVWRRRHDPFAAACTTRPTPCTRPTRRRRPSMGEHHGGARPKCLACSRVGKPGSGSPHLQATADRSRVCLPARTAREMLRNTTYLIPASPPSSVFPVVQSPLGAPSWRE